MFGEIALSFQQGNVYLYIMLAVGFIATVIAFERLIMFQFVYNINFEKFTANLKKMLTADDLDRAANFCKSVGSTSLPYIAYRAVEAADNDPTTVRGTIEEETISFLPRLETRVNILVSMSTIIMFVGILGTIDSLWKTFHAIDVLDSTKKQIAVSQDIASALNPIALGLLLSMIVLVSHQMLRGMSVRLVDRIHHGVAVLYNLMVPQGIVMTAAAAPIGGGGMSSQGQTEPMQSHDAPMMNTQPATAVGGPQTDATFDDASVQDIRDEEEII